MKSNSEKHSHKIQLTRNKEIFFETKSRNIYIYSLRENKWMRIQQNNYSIQRSTSSYPFYFLPTCSLSINNLQLSPQSLSQQPSATFCQQEEQPFTIIWTWIYEESHRSVTQIKTVLWVLTGAAKHKENKLQTFVLWGSLI